MSKLDLTSQEWCDLVFEGKNKRYGAYMLRKESSKRHNWATLFIVIIALIGFSAPVLIKMVLPKRENIVVTEVTTLSNLPQIEKKEIEQPKIEVIPPPPLKSSIKFTPPVIKKDEEVKDEEEIKAQKELSSSKASISIADVKGTDEVHGKDIAELKEIVVEEVRKPFHSVEQMPSFPGGEDKLFEYLSTNVHYPEIALTNGVQGRVIVRFVVSKTGDITDVEVIRSVDNSCDREAMRVVRAMPRWIPGKQNGEAVPVYYVVPIVFRIQ